MNSCKLDSSIEEPMVSPKKKKKSKSVNKDEIEANNSSASNGTKVTELPNLWNKEESELLLEACLKITSQMNSKKQRCKKSKFFSIMTIAFEQMSLKKTADECEDHLKDLFDGIETMRTWEEILNDAIVELDNNKKKGPLTGFSKFYKENYDKIRTEHDKNSEANSKQLMTAQHMWSSLSVAEKEPYLSKNETKIPKSVYEAFFMSKQAKHPDLKLSEARSKYAKLSADRKVKYIKKYLNILQEKDASVDDAAETVSDNQTVIKGVKKDDMKLLMLHLNAPQPVAPNVSLYYMKTNNLDEGIVLANKLITATKLYSKLSFEQKNWWTTKFAEAHEKYLTRVKEWKESQTKVICNLYDKVYPQVNKILSQKKSKAKLQVTAPGPTFKMTFPNEPKAPPATVTELCSYVSNRKRIKSVSASAASPTKLNIKPKRYLRSLNMDYFDELVSNVETCPLFCSTPRNDLDINRRKSPMKNSLPQSSKRPNVSEFVFQLKVIPCF